MKSTTIERKVAVHILTNAYRALLSVKEFVIAVFIFHPIHNVERKAFYNCFDNGVALFLFIYKFALKCRANIQFSAISDNAVFFIVYIIFDYLSNRNFMQFNFH